MILIVNNSKRYEGTSTNFSVNLSPPITFSKITLLYATISNPINDTQPYYMISISDITPNNKPARYYRDVYHSSYFIRWDS